MFELTFVNAAMLGATAAGAAPVIIHLLTRQRPKLVKFPALRFVRKSARVSSRRFRLKHLLLLALRVLIICLFAFIIARPILKSERFAVAGQPIVHAAIILDDSYSMTYEEQGASRFDRAKRLAAGLLDNFGVGSQAALVLTSEALGNLTMDLARVQANIREAKPSATGSRCWPALKRAVEILQKPQVAGKVIYLFTDLTARSWDLADAKAGSLTSLGQDISLCVVDVGSERNTNFFLTKVEPSKSVVNLGARVRVSADIAAAEEGGMKSVSLFIDGQRKYQKALSLAKNSTQRFEFEHVFEAAGTYPCCVELSGVDALALDNRRFFTVTVRPPTQVLCVNGDPKGDESDELFFLTRALNPFAAAERQRVKCEAGDVSVLGSRDFAGADVVILANVKSVDGQVWVRLRDWVANGGGLLIFGGDKLDAASYNADKAAPLLPAHFKRVKTAQTGVALSLAGAKHPALTRFLDFQYGDLGAPRFTAFHELAVNREDASVTTVLAFDDGSSALVERQYQRGRVMLMASSADADWTDLPKYPCFVAFAHEMVEYLRPAAMVVRDCEIGDVVTVALPPSEARAEVTITAPGMEQGARLALDPLSSIAAFRDTREPGAYAVCVKSGDGAQRLLKFSVNVDARESDLRRLDEREVAKFFPQGAVRVARDESGLRATVGQTKAGREVFPVLAVLLLALLLAESFLSNRFYEA